MILRAQGTRASARHEADQLARDLAGRRQKLTSRMLRIRRGIRARLSPPVASPTLLLLAAGAGVLLDQVSRRRGTSLTKVLGAADAGTRFLLTLATASGVLDRFMQPPAREHDPSR